MYLTKCPRTLALQKMSSAKISLRNGPSSYSLSKKCPPLSKCPFNKPGTMINYYVNSQIKESDRILWPGLYNFFILTNDFIIYFWCTTKKESSCNKDSTGFFLLLKRSYNSLIHPSIHCKKKRCFTEPPKKVREMSKSIQIRPKSQKKNKKIYETFKGSSRVSRGRTFSYETFF
jgi:hypothetical protein